MPLTYPPEWKFGDDDTIGTMPNGAIDELHELAAKIASGAPNEQGVVEMFKSAFAGSLGRQTSQSSNKSWALSDLADLMGDAKSNAATFIDAYWTGLTRAAASGVTVPAASHVNKILHKHGVSFEIKPPHLNRRNDAVIVLEQGAKGTATRGGSTSSWQYEVHEKLGEGGYGVVHRVTRETGGGPMEFALKFLDPSPFAEDPERAQARFKREVQAIQGMQHRGIVTYLDAGTDQLGRPFLVMPRIIGSRYDTYAQGLPMADRGRLMVEVLGAVVHAHECKVLHRDLKPSNVIVRASDGQPIIVDFGQAYLLEEASGDSLTTKLIGSAGYVPPEVLADPKGNRSPLHDVYSCGVMLYESIAGFRPDPTSIASLGRVDPGLAPLDAIVGRALATAGARYPDARTFRDELADCLIGVRLSSS